MKTLILGLALLLAPITSANAYLSVSPGSIYFGSVKVGSQTGQSFWVTNYGNEDVRIYGCNVFGAFQCQLYCYGVLHRGESCNGMIYFRPAAERYEFDTAMIQTDRSFLSISVQGSGQN